MGDIGESFSEIINELGQAEVAHQVWQKVSETGERYLPSKAIAALSDSEYAATTRAKRKGKASGKQFVAQPKAIADKVRKYRT